MWLVVIREYFITIRLFSDFLDEPIAFTNYSRLDNNAILSFIMIQGDTVNLDRVRIKEDAPVSTDAQCFPDFKKSNKIIQPSAQSDSWWGDAISWHFLSRKLAKMQISFCMQRSVSGMRNRFNEGKQLGALLKALIILYVAYSPKYSKAAVL